MRTPPIANTILDAIGHTPLVRINRLTRDATDAEVFAKLETFNPGNSIKDRIAVKMIEDALRQAIDADERRVADRVENRVAHPGWSRHRSIIGPAPRSRRPGSKASF